MHDTASHIGKLAMNIYADLHTDSVLEVGSQSVNGALREHALPTTRYVGIDIEEGEGVDLVVQPGKPLPVEDNEFDLVIASSVFEHDSCFWMTFLEMCRATKDGGYIYINAPSNGVVHRFPQDNWRFYPDSGRALAQWATSQGMHVTLVESFIAERTNDIWNDFVAVFRKGRITKPLPAVFIHEHVPCSNVLTWKSNEILNERDETQDMILLNESRIREAAVSERQGELEAEIADLDSRRDALEREIAVAREEQLRLTNEASDARRAAEELRSNLALKESELRQRQEEIEQTRSDLAKISANLESSDYQLKHEGERRRRAESGVEEWKELHDREQARAIRLSAAAAEARDEFERREAELSKLLAEVRADKDDVQAQLTRRIEEIASVTRQLQLARETAEQARAELEHSEALLRQSRTDKERLEARLDERFREISTLTTMLVEREAQVRQSMEEVDWLRQAGSVLANGSNTLKGRLLALLPASLHYRRQRKLLKRKGLFDGEAYLAANSDVAAEGADPLQHYIKHGMTENRHRG